MCPVVLLINALALCTLPRLSLSTQLNLVFVYGIAPSLAREAELERAEFFGQYGKVVKVVVNRQGLQGVGGTDAPRALSASA